MRIHGRLVELMVGVRRSRVWFGPRGLALCLLPALVGLLSVAAPARAATGRWDRAWGLGVNGGSAFGICTVAANCQKGMNGSVGGGLLFPEGVATDAAGNVYIGDGGNDRIEKFDSSGNWLRSFGADVGGSGVDVCTVAASCQAGSTGGLGGEMGQPYGVATDAAGNVYVADFSNNRIQKFDSSGNWLRAFGDDVGGSGVDICTVAASCQAGSTGGLGGELNQPQYVATDGAGNVYVADSAGNRIQVFDSSGNWLRAFGDDVGGSGVDICTVAASCQGGSTGGLGGEMNGPFGIATDAAGNVYVADSNNNRIQKFDSSGNWLAAWGKGVNGGSAFGICTVAASCHAGSTGGLGGEMNGPFGVATDAAGNVYVADSNNGTFGNNRIQVFDSSGNFLRAWGKGVNGGSAFGICTVAASCHAGSSGTLGGEMNIPQGVAADAAGDVYVADSGSSRIQKFPGPVLSVSLAGTGSGTVTGSGISCPGMCTMSYLSGTGVTLTATAASGSTFMGWSGACTGTGTCSVTMSSDQAVSAAFTKNPSAAAGPPHGTKITKVKINEKKQAVTFRFTAAGTVTGFQCELIKPKVKGRTAPKPKFTACSSAKTYKHLKPGRYTFKVRAVNSAGPDPQPATKKFKI